MASAILPSMSFTLQKVTILMMILAGIQCYSVNFDSDNDLDPNAIWINSDNPEIGCPKILKPYYVKDPKGPSYFYRCKYGFAVEYRCPDEQIFDFLKKTCRNWFDDASEPEDLSSDETFNADDDESEDDPTSNEVIDRKLKQSAELPKEPKEMLLSVIKVETVIVVEKETSVIPGQSKFKQIVVDTSNVLLQYTSAFANGLCKLVGC